MLKCLKNGNFIIVGIIFPNVSELMPFSDLTLCLLDNQSLSPEAWPSKAGMWRQAGLVAQSGWSEPGREDDGTHVEVRLAWELEPDQAG